MMMEIGTDGRGVSMNGLLRDARNPFRQYFSTSENAQPMRCAKASGALGEMPRSSPMTRAVSWRERVKSDKPVYGSTKVLLEINRSVVAL